jgi:hypothetical protein
LKKDECQVKTQALLQSADIAIFFIVMRGYAEVGGLKITVFLLLLCLLSIDVWRQL